MNNENKYQFINNLPKEYHHILWDIMIKAECNHFVDRPKGLSKQECKLIMRFLYKLFNNKEIDNEYRVYYNLKEENKQLKDKIPYIIQNNSCKYISIEKCKNKVCVNYKMQELQGSDSNE